MSSIATTRPGVLLWFCLLGTGVLDETRVYEVRAEAGRFDSALSMGSQLIRQGSVEANCSKLAGTERKRLQVNSGTLILQLGELFWSAAGHPPHRVALGQEQGRVS